MANKDTLEGKEINSRFMAAAAQVDITPPLGTFINGDFINHYARFIHDRLFCKTLVLKTPERLLAITVVDICEMPVHYVNEIKALIYKETQLAHDNIMISSTHTHAAGAVDGMLLSSVDMAYRQKLPGLILESVRNALKDIKPAKIAFGRTDVPEHVRCRRYVMKEGYLAENPTTGKPDKIKTNPFGAEQLIDRPAAATDPELSVLAVKGLDEQWIAVLGNYSLHYVGDWPDDTISADYFGEFGRQIKKALNAGDDFVGMMSNGTSGDVNIWDFMKTGNYPAGHFEKTKVIAGDLSAKAITALEHALWEMDPKLEVKYETVELTIRKPTAEQLSAAAKTVIETDYANLKLEDDGMFKIYAREQILLNEFPDSCRLPLQVFRIGETTIGMLPGEFFAETGLWLKYKMAGKNYFTITLANGCEGYIPPAHELEKGGYEAWLARTSCLEENAENKIKNKLLTMLQSGYVPAF
jgi:hypothetical protein